jgi:hypothetical protein
MQSSPLGTKERSHKNETSAISGQSVILPSQGAPPMLQPHRPNHKYIIEELMLLRATVEVNNLFSLQMHKKLSVKGEVWFLSWDFQPWWSAPANKGICRPKSGCTLCSDFFQYWLGLGLGLIMRICEDCDRAVPTPWYFHFVISRCSLLLPSIMILNRQNTKVFSEQFQPKGPNY